MALTERAVEDKIETLETKVAALES